jgi:hypothetical protein
LSLNLEAANDSIIIPESPQDQNATGYQEPSFMSGNFLTCHKIICFRRFQLCQPITLTFFVNLITVIDHEEEVSTSEAAIETAGQIQILGKYFLIPETSLIKSIRLHPSKTL